MEATNNKKETCIGLYNIEKDGCLVGVYTDSGDSRGEIFPEIFKKRKEELPEVLITGTYDSGYIETGKPKAISDLVLIVTCIGNNTYNFEWKNGTTTVFHGTGFRMNEKQIAVSYIKD